MRKTSLYIFVLFASLVTFGQNTNRFSQFNFVKSLYNPGALATDASFTADLIYRNQWAGVDGAPSTFGFNSAYELTDEMAVGINFYNDQIGLTKTTSFSASYAYRVIFDKRKYLAFGLGLGTDNVNLGLASATTTEANDPAFSQSLSRFNFNGSFGIYYRTPTFYAGVSIPQLFQNSLVGTETDFRPDRWHYIAVSGYFWEVSDRLVLNPSIQLKATKYAPLQGDIIVRAITRIVGFSAGYRSEKTVIAGIDFTLADRIRIGYAFNADLGPLAKTKGFSHEVYLGIGLPYYFNSETFGSNKYVGRKGSSKVNYRRSYTRSNRKFRF
jgi:type IX secretion system PorP/SprF family membrane protein